MGGFLKIGYSKWKKTNNKIGDKREGVKTSLKKSTIEFWVFLQIIFLKSSPHVYWRPYAYHILIICPPNMLIEDHTINRDSRVGMQALTVSCFCGVRIKLATFACT